MIRRIDPDEAVILNGFPVTGRQLAEARQELSHRGVHNPRWAELSEYDRDMAALSAGSWLRALAGLVVMPDPDHACAAHDDAHLGQPCPDRTVARPQACCEFHDRGDEPCAPDDQGGYCCDRCPALVGTTTAPYVTGAKP
jgi:hypothetical protein